MNDFFERWFDGDHFHGAVSEVVVLEGVGRFVDHNAAVVDDHGASAECFDVADVVTGEKESDAFFAIDATQDFAEGFFGDDVEADGGFVEEDDFWFVNEGDGDFGPHALTERELADGTVDEFSEIEEADEFFLTTTDGGWGEFVNGAEEFEGVADRKIRHELGALAEEGANAEGQLAAVFVRVEAGHGHVARRGVKNAGEHLNRRRLPCPVRANKSDSLPFRHRKADVVDGGDNLFLWLKKVAQAALFWLTHGQTKAFDEMADGDGGHNEVIIAQWEVLGATQYLG